MKEGLIIELQTLRQFFLTSTSCLREEESQYAPKDEMMTVAQQVAHVAQTVDWFMDGAFESDGFDLNFEQHMQAIKESTSLSKALAWFNKAIDDAIRIVQNIPESELTAPLPEGPIMGGAPKLAVIGAISDHTAHHRGALTVYSRLLGKVPPMPYGDA